MPVYEFECSACKIAIEIQMKITDDRLPVCQECHKEMKKIMSRTSFILKGGGSGWFRDGYTNNGLPDKNGNI